MMPHLPALLIATLLFAAQASPVSAGSVSGKVKFSGPAPELTRLAVNSDEKCAARNPEGVREQWAIVGADGGVANAFVYISAGAPADSPAEASKPVVLSNDGCMFAPHVVGVRAGQPLQITNADDTEHKVQSLPKKNRRFSATIAPGAKPVQKKMDTEEVMIRVKCNAHRWESAYVGVLPHGFFAVSDETGAFKIDELPPGAYTLTAWHEAFGTKKAEFKLEEEGAPPNVDFTFEPASD